MNDGRESFRQLWFEHHQRVYGYALRRTDPASAQDVVSETFLIAWRRSGGLPLDPLPWLLGVARHVLANHARSQRRRNALAQVLVDQALSSHPGPGDVDGGLLRALASLSAADREVLLLTAWDGLTTGQAARVVECSAGTFRVRLLRARRRLRDALENPPIPQAPEPEVECA